MFPFFYNKNQAQSRAALRAKPWSGELGGPSHLDFELEIEATADIKKLQKEYHSFVLFYKEIWRHFQCRFFGTPPGVPADPTLTRHPR